MKTSSKGILRSPDLRKYIDLTFMIPLGLSCFSLLIIASAAGTMPDGGIRAVIIQAIGILIGFSLAVILTRLNIRNMKYFGMYFFFGSALLLLLVLLIGTGEEQLGSKSWIQFGFFSFQPSEIVKIAFIIICAIFLERIMNKQDVLTNYIKLTIYSGIIVLLVLLQKDFGTAAVFIFIFIFMNFIAGVSRKIIYSAIFIILVSIPIFWIFILNDSRKDRFKVFLNPELDPLNSGYNVLQSKMAIGSGRLLGQGLFEGYLNTHSLIPVKDSDFIFAVVGEELGFIGAAVIVVLFLVFLLNMLQIARKSKDRFCSLITYGVFAMFAFHIIQNISMTLGLLPVTGVPLPFVSAGGTALVSYFIAVGFTGAVSQKNRLDR